VSEQDRSRWLDPSPPIPVDGEETEAPRTRRPAESPDEQRPPATADEADDAASD
jgi:hypothetical protein